MTETPKSHGDTIIKAWQGLSPIPGGAWLFSRLIGLWIPYSGTLGARVTVLRPGYARLNLRDHRRIRNHLHSIHAIALVNLGEITSGLALLTGLPPHIRGIVTKISIEYFKKARGRLRSESTVTLPSISTDMDHLVHAEIHDHDDECVARTTVQWRLGPI